jgi:hypothetical protein
MSERIEHRDEIKPGRAAGRCDAVIRSIGLAWLVFAVLLAFAPARAEVALEKYPTARTFSPFGSTILQRDLASAYFVDLRARLEWSRTADRHGSADQAGHTGLIPATLRLRTPDLDTRVPRTGHPKTHLRLVRLFDARAPPRPV